MQRRQRGVWEQGCWLWYATEETSALGTEREDILGGAAWPGAEHLWCSSEHGGILLVSGAVSILRSSLFIPCSERRSGMTVIFHFPSRSLFPGDWLGSLTSCPTPIWRGFQVDAGGGESEQTCGSADIAWRSFAGSSLQPTPPADTPSLVSEAPTL